MLRAVLVNVVDGQKFGVFFSAARATRSSVRVEHIHLQSLTSFACLAAVLHLVVVMTQPMNFSASRAQRSIRSRL